MKAVLPPWEVKFVAEKKGRATPRPDKVEYVQKMKEQIESSPAIVFVDWIGLDADQITKIRRELKKKGVKPKVVKNTLFKRALSEAGKEEISKLVVGPTMVMFAEDPIDVLKTVVDLSKEYEQFSLRGVYFEGKVYEKKEAEALAKLPSKQELQAMFLGVLQAPMRNLLHLLNAPSRLVNVLMRRKEQLEG